MIRSGYTILTHIYISMTEICVLSDLSNYRSTTCQWNVRNREVCGRPQNNFSHLGRIIDALLFPYILSHRYISTFLKCFCSCFVGLYDLRSKNKCAAVECFWCVAYLCLQEQAPHLVEQVNELMDEHDRVLVGRVVHELHTYIYVYIYVYMYICIYTCIYMYDYTCTYKCAYMCICIYTCICVCIYIYMST